MYRLIVSLLAVLSICLVSGQVFGQVPTDPENQRQDLFNEAGALPAKAIGRLLNAATDLFPAINDPHYVPAKEASQFLKSEDVVYALSDGELLMVYPKAIMDYHHIVNTTFGAEQTPIAITRCILANTIIVYDRRVGGEVLSFSTTQETPHGTLVLNDQNGNLWTQMDGYSAVIDGRYSRSAGRLKPFVNAVTTTWGAIGNAATSGSLLKIRVLAPPAEFFVKYSPSKRQDRFAVAGKATNAEEAWAVYEDIKCICAQEENGDPIGNIGVEGVGVYVEDDRLEMHEMGLGVRIHGEAKFYPLSSIEEKGIIFDEVGGWSIIVVHDKERNTHRIFRINGHFRRDNVTLQDDGNMREWVSKSVWNRSGVAVSGRKAGDRLEEPAFTTVYWFSWSGYFYSGIYGEDG
jgi:hypothetical protein